MALRSLAHLSKERVRNLMAVCLSVAAGHAVLDSPSIGLVPVALAQLSEFWAAIWIISWPKLNSSGLGLKSYPSAGMASATARVNSLLICQCFAKRALKSFSAGPLAAAAVPARNDTTSKPVNVTFIGFSSKPHILLTRKR